MEYKCGMRGGEYSYSMHSNILLIALLMIALFGLVKTQEDDTVFDDNEASSLDANNIFRKYNETD